MKKGDKIRFKVVEYGWSEDKDLVITRKTDEVLEGRFVKHDVRPEGKSLIVQVPGYELPHRVDPDSVIQNLMGEAC